MSRYQIAHPVTGNPVRHADTLTDAILMAEDASRCHDWRLFHIVDRSLWRSGSNGIIGSFSGKDGYVNLTPGA